MAMGVGVSEEFKAEAMRLYVEDGLSTLEVAQRLGMSQSWVGTLRKQRGIPLHPRGKTLNAQQIVHCYVNEGLTIADLADRERVDSTRIRRLLVDSGVRIVSRVERQTKIDVDEVRRLYEVERLSQPAVAARLGVSASGVWAVMVRHNIPTRSAAPLTVSRSELAKHLNAGLTNSDIAERYGVTTWRIKKRIQELGLRRPNASRRHVAPPASELKNKYLVEEQTIVALAEHYETTHSTVRSWLVASGISIGDGRPGTANRRDRDLGTEELRQLYVEQGLPSAAIAAQLGVTKNVVLTMLRSGGIPLRQSGPARPANQLPLLDRLYQDGSVCETLQKHGVPLVPTYGPLRERFPERPALSHHLLMELYERCGLSISMISLLVGYGEAAIRARMREAGIATRAGGGRSPWTQSQ